MWFVHNIDPVIFSVGPFEVRYYGLVYVIGFLLAYWILLRFQKKGELNISRDDLDLYIVYLMLGVIIGSRIFHILFWNPSWYFSHPLDIFKLWEGGLAFHGGLAGSALVTWWFCKKHKLSFWKMADILVIPAVLVLALGRIANFINGNLWGTPTDVSWCVEFQRAEGCRHPSQLYGSLKRFAIFAVLLVLNRKKHKNGFLFWMFVTLMGAGRFALDFFREDARFLGLSAGQYLSAIMLITGAYILYKYYRSDLFRRSTNH